jgi:uridine kinase
VVERCRAEGLLADAVLLRIPTPVTFWRRLVRDQREGRKPPLVLLRQGLGKLRAERGVLARQEDLGCRPLSKVAAGEVLGSFG